MLLSLVLMRIYIAYFQDQQILGVWFTLLSILNWILTFDFGLGNGLRNSLVAAIAKDNIHEQKNLISTTYTLSVSFACIIFVVCFCALQFVNVNAVLNISDTIIQTNYLRTSMYIVLFSVILQFVLKNVNSILYALQMPSLSNFTGLLTNILIFLSLWILTPNGCDGQNLITLSFIYLIASNIPLLTITLTLFLTRLKKVRPNFKFVNRSTITHIVRLGGGFFIIQLLSLALFGVREILITQLWGPEWVVDYQVYYKIFNLVASLSWIALVPIWSAVTDAYIREDYDWIKRAYSKLKILMCLVSLGLVFLILIFQFIINIWLGEKTIQVNSLYSLAFSVNSGLYIWWGIVASFANGTGKIKLQMLCSIIGVVINFALSVILKLLGMGWIAVMIAGSVAMLPYCILEPRNIKRLIKKGNNL